MSWSIWTDGSCRHNGDTPSGGIGWGGWAAIVEHGSDGHVVRGSEEDTTNVRMELVAAIEGLREAPDGATVLLHTDSTAVMSATRPGRNCQQVRDHDLWTQLAAETERLQLTVNLLGRGPRDRRHMRAHLIAGAEAAAAREGLPAEVMTAKRHKALRRYRAASEELHLDHRLLARYRSACAP